MIGLEAAVKSVYDTLAALTSGGTKIFAGHFDYAEPRAAKNGLPSFTMSAESVRLNDMPQGFEGGLPDSGWLLYTIAVAVHVDRRNLAPEDSEKQERLISEAIMTAFLTDPTLGGTVFRAFFPYQQFDQMVEDGDQLYFRSVCLFQVIDLL